MWNWLKNLFVSTAKALFTIAADFVYSKAISIINDKELQALALAAVKAAAKRALTGDKAWVAARDAFTAALAAKGKDIGNAAIDTLLQLAYYCFKNEVPETMDEE